MTVGDIIAQNKETLDIMANKCAMGLYDEANRDLHRFFVKCGYKTDCDDTYYIIDYVQRLVQNSQTGWKTVTGFEDYEISEAMEIRRKDNRKIIKDNNNKGAKTIKLRKDGKYHTVRIIELWYNTYHKKESMKKDETFEMPLENTVIDIPMMTGDLEWSSTTETNKAE